MKHTGANQDEISIKLRNNENTIPLNEDIKHSVNNSELGQSQQPRSSCQNNRAKEKVKLSDNIQTNHQSEQNVFAKQLEQDNDPSQYSTVF